MLILAMDTSTSAITVAVGEGGSAGDVLAAHTRIDVRGHTEHLAPLIESVLAQAGCLPRDLGAIAVGTGPGPFTGLRVGVVTALTMGHALRVPVLGVCSLDALAAAVVGSVPEGEFVVATDARRTEVYWARYAARSGRARRLTDPAVERPVDVPDPVRALPTAGRGPVLFPDLFPATIEVLDVDARDVLRLAADGWAKGEALPVEPLYLRRPDALTTAERGAS